MTTGPTVYLETFGCQMNELDSELVRGHLRALGYRFIEDFTKADVVLYNTCSVREQAENKAYSRLGLVGMRKKAGEQVILGVLGCMAERDGIDMLRRFPQVDLLGGRDQGYLAVLLQVHAHRIARERCDAARVGRALLRLLLSGLGRHLRSRACPSRSCRTRPPADHRLDAETRRRPRRFR